MDITINTNTNFKGLYDPNVLITGCSGYIGSNLVKRLSQKGYNCIVCSRSTAKKQYIRSVIDEINRYKQDKSLLSFTNFDLCDKTATEMAFEHNQPIDAVIHLAGATQNVESLKNPRKYYNNNLLATLNLLNVMIDRGIKKLLFMSTGSTYGKTELSVIDEMIKQKPETPYAKSKVMIEEILKDYTDDLQSTIIRLFNVAGANTPNDLEIGNNFVSVLLQRIKQNNVFALMGNKYPTPDNTCIKDYLHIDDVCSAIEKALDKLFEGNKSNIFNLGSGEGVSLGEIIRKAETITQRKVNLRIVGAPVNETPIMIVNNSKIKNELNWKPNKNIDDILTSAWNWTLKN